MGEAGSWSCLALKPESLPPTAGCRQEEKDWADADADADAGADAIANASAYADASVNPVPDPGPDDADASPDSNFDIAKEF